MYCVREVTQNLYWVGANDHRLHLFENVYPIPRGVSYNAFLLLDRESVLFDTVDWSACRQMMENVEHLLQGHNLDWLVVNHMEPDHAACVQEVLRRWPGVKIIATEKAFTYMRQFGFRPDAHEIRAVKDGDTQCFGDHTVAFVTAPMVHWPEAMVTFDTTNGVLFSADAFGSFIALDGKLFADEVNFDRDWIDEARRYLTNIVGKYGMPVQALLKKAGGILDKIRIVCPLHGPVWRKDLLYLVEKYDKWSRYEPEERGVLIVYGSMYGNTESAAQALAARLCEKGVRTAVYDVSNTHVSYLIAEAFKFSHIVIASPTYNMGMYPPVHHFLTDMAALNLQKRTFAVIENGTWACKSGELIRKFVQEEMKDMTVLEQGVRFASSMGEDKAADLEALAEALAASVRE